MNGILIKLGKLFCFLFLISSNGNGVASIPRQSTPGYQNTYGKSKTEVNLDLDGGNECRDSQNIYDQSDAHSPNEPLENVTILAPKSRCFKMFNKYKCSGTYILFRNYGRTILKSNKDKYIHQENRLLNYQVTPASFQLCSQKEKSGLEIAICKAEFGVEIEIGDVATKYQSESCQNINLPGEGKMSTRFKQADQFQASVSVIPKIYNQICIELYSKLDCDGKSVQMVVEHDFTSQVIWKFHYDKNGNPNLDKEQEIMSVRKCSQCLKKNFLDSTSTVGLRTKRGKQCNIKSTCDVEMHKSTKLIFFKKGSFCNGMPIAGGTIEDLHQLDSSQRNGLSFASCENFSDCKECNIDKKLADVLRKPTTSQATPTTMEIVILSVASSLAFIMLIVVIVLSIMLWQKKRRIRQVRSRALKRNPTPRFPPVSQIQPIGENDYVNDITGLMSICRSFSTEGYAISRRSINIGSIRDSTATILGMGEYSIAFRGTLEPGGRVVAVKTMKSGQATTRSIKGVLRECQVLMQVGRSSRIVNFIGVCTESVRQGEIFLVMEFCEKGSLKSFLNQNRSHFCNLVKSGELSADDEHTIMESPQCTIQEVGSKGSVKFNTLQLFKWCCEVADAMEYLALRKIVHVSLSARNVLLDSKYGTKLSDFHLAKTPHDSGAYYGNMNRININKDRSVPWRWFAVESLLEDIFTTQTDVWTFGVFMWEIFMLGGTPYQEYCLGPEFTMSIKHGYRLPQPNYATVESYELMLNCWYDAPEKRPTFSKLKAKLSTVIRSCLRQASRDKLDQLP